MQQPDEWEFQANRILLSGKPPHFAPAKPELLVIEQRLAALAASLQRPPSSWSSGPPRNWPIWDCAKAATSTGSTAARPC